MTAIQLLQGYFWPQTNLSVIFQYQNEKEYPDSHITPISLQGANEQHSL